MNNSKLLTFQPTKTWLKEHKARPVECRCSDCVCIMDNFNQNHQGYCVGYYGHSGDLDMISFCWIAWDADQRELKWHNALFHPQEATAVALFLNWAVASLWHMIPEYRKSVANMARKRTWDIKAKGQVDGLASHP